MTGFWLTAVKNLGQIPQMLSEIFTFSSHVIWQSVTLTPETNPGDPRERPYAVVPLPLDLRLAAFHPLHVFSRIADRIGSVAVCSGTTNQAGAFVAAANPFQPVILRSFVLF